VTALDTAFAATALLAVIGGLFAVTTRHVVHAALWLVVALLGVAGSLLVLGAELVALCSCSSTWAPSSCSCSSR
jgi:NADH-quinone oxidoreductase subunit J